VSGSQPHRELLESLVAAELPDLIRIRRDLHAHPGLAFEESYASEVVQAKLRAARVPFVAGIGGKGAGAAGAAETGTARTAGGTGVVAWLAPERTEGIEAVALRADMDALPIQEETGLPYASTVRGSMHACGHDGHMTILLGAARVLEKLKDRLPGPVKFLFQPAEETTSGAELLIEGGALDERTGGARAGRVFGLHAWPGLPAGVVATRAGPLMAACDFFRIGVRGKGGHASAPQEGRDPIVASAQIITAIQSIVSRNVHPCEPAVITVAAVRAGEADNVIPDEASLRGTIRTTADATAATLHRRLREVAEGVAGALGCSAAVEIWRGAPATCNDPAATEIVLEVARDVLGPDRAIVMERPVMGAEDFAFYGKRVPACFFFLGNGREKGEAAPGLHTAQYDFNDDIIGAGIRILCGLALRRP